MIAANSYSASLTREQFLSSETRIVAQLMDKGLDEAAIYEKPSSFTWRSKVNR